MPVNGSWGCGRVRRLHLFEFDELEWYPSTFRDAVTDALRFFSLKFNIYGPVIPRLKRVMRSLECREVVDLCSGGSGPITLIQKRLKREGYPVRVTLTDKYPNIEAFRKACAEGEDIDFVEEAVDALDVPVHIEGFRTLFASLHHFKPHAARRILEDAFGKEVGIGVFEFTDRSPVMFLVMLFSPVLIMSVIPFIRPFTWKKFLWTYLIPLIPITGLWDGIVSNLRSYTPVELQQLVKGLERDNYAWEIGKVQGVGLHKITFLLGYPT